MSFFEKAKITNASGIPINPATEDSLIMLKRILTLLKPLGQITGGGSNRLSVDVNNVVAFAATVPTVTTVTTVSTVSTVSNQTNIAGISAFEMLKALSRDAYNNGIRSRLS